MDDRIPKLTKAQHGLLSRLASGQLLIGYRPPGNWDAPTRWHIEKPYSDEDGRTAESIVARGLVRHEGDNLYVISTAGLSALKAISNG